MNLRSLSLMHTHDAISWSALHEKFYSDKMATPVRFFIFDASNNSYREGEFHPHYDWNTEQLLITRRFMVYQPRTRSDDGLRVWTKFYY